MFNSMIISKDLYLFTDNKKIATTLMQMTDNHGIDAAFDPVGAGLISHYSPALSRDATIFCYGALDGEFPQMPIVDMFQVNATYHPYSVFNYVEDSIMLKKGISFIYDALESKKLLPNIDRVYPMEGYRNACEYMSKTRTKHGKVIVKTGL